MSIKTQSSNQSEQVNLTLLLILYTTCFSIAPAALIAFIMEPTYHIFLSRHRGDLLFWVFALLALPLFGITLAVWRFVNSKRG